MNEEQKDKNFKVGILYVCTGKYDVFWKDFFISYEKFFLPSCIKEYFVFTDSDSLYGEECGRIHKIYREHREWPYDTLMRYHMFIEHRQLYGDVDYLFFMNANCQCVDYIKEAAFLPEEGKLIIVQHPGQYMRKPEKYTYDRNKKSTAYIPRKRGEIYVCGGVNGGTKEAFLAMSEEIMRNVDTDLYNGIIAKWHDESHINKYILQHDNWKMLSPSYCYPEDWNIPFEPKILIRDKSRYFDTVRDKHGILQSYTDKIKWIIKKIIQ